jgi:hypothetical protein
MLKGAVLPVMKAVLEFQQINTVEVKTTINTYKPGTFEINMDSF